jgi:hypothetical protein
MCDVLHHKIEAELCLKWSNIPAGNCCPFSPTDHTHVFEEAVPSHCCTWTLLGDVDLLLGFKVPIDHDFPKFIEFSVQRKGAHTPGTFRMDENTFLNSYKIEQGASDTALESYAVVVTGQHNPLVMTKMPGHEVIAIYADVVYDDVHDYLGKNWNDSFKLTR